MEITIQPAYQEPEAIRELLVEYTGMLLEQNPAFAGYLKQQNFAAELDNLQEKYGVPEGRLYLVRADGAPAGCVAMKKLDAQRCELKRLYIRPAFRGQGLARRLVERLLTDARSEGYQAVQLGFGEVSAKKVNKAAAGHFKKANVAPKKTLREFRLEDVSAMNVGDVLKADVFAEGDKVDVVGVSKGKGYQGVIKRYGQHRLRESHGTGPVARHAGSNGSTSTPARVFPGKRLPGHMGFVRVTVQNLTVVKVDTENNLIAVKGAVPGSKGTIITLANSVKA